MGGERVGKKLWCLSHGLNGWYMYMVCNNINNNNKLLLLLFLLTSLIIVLNNKRTITHGKLCKYNQGRIMGESNVVKNGA